MCQRVCKKRRRSVLLLHLSLYNERTAAKTQHGSVGFWAAVGPERGKDTDDYDVEGPWAEDPETRASPRSHLLRTRLWGGPGFELKPRDLQSAWPDFVAQGSSV